MVEKWSIYWVAPDPVIGPEQAGKRPALIISNDIVNEILPVVTILPLSSIKANSRVYSTEVLLPKEISFLPKDSVAMIHQIRTIDKMRIHKQCGRINDINTRNRINDVLRDYLEI
jgi:mRNA interferase MazF